jgi:LemA protein
LIPNLVNTVKGYANQEKDIFTDIANARSKLSGATNITDQANADSELTNALSRLLVVVERYPDLKSNENFKDLSHKLVKIEDDVANARKYYNGTVRIFNDKVQMFPSNIIAGIFGYKAKKMFEANENERENVKVNF